MTVPTSLVSRPIAGTPPVARHTAPSDVSHLHVVLRPGQANGMSASSSTLLPSHPTATSSHSHVVSHVARPRVTPYPVPSGASSAPPSTLLASNSNVDSSNTALPSPHHVASHVSHPCVPPCAVQTSVSFASSSTPLPNASTHVSHPRVASHLKQANGSSSSASPFPSRPTSPSYVPTATSSRFHNASHEPHPRIAPRFVLSRTPSAPSFTLPISHSTPHISSTPLVAHSHFASRPERTNGTFNASPTPLPSRSTAHPTSACSLPPRRKRSRRCFVCGGTGKHRLNPRFCPRTYELLSKNLVKFDANFRLVSDDGSPLPMTRHPGGVAAHLLSPRRLRPRTVRVVPRSVSKSPGTSQSNPPHVPHAPRDPPVPVPHHVPDAVPIADENPPHAPPAVVEHPRRISVPDRRFESNPPHFPREERPSSPPFRILSPFRESLPRPETPRYPDNAFILLLLDCLTLSPSWRRELAGLIDAINRLNLDDDIPALQKLMEPIRERYKTFVPSI